MTSSSAFIPDWSITTASPRSMCTCFLTSRSSPSNPGLLCPKSCRTAASSAIFRSFGVGSHALWLEGGWRHDSEGGGTTRLTTCFTYAVHVSAPTSIPTPVYMRRTWYTTTICYMLLVTWCVSRVACHVLRIARCMVHGAWCVLRGAWCVVCDAHLAKLDAEPKKMLPLTLTTRWPAAVRVARVEIWCDA